MPGMPARRGTSADLALVPLRVHKDAWHKMPEVERIKALFGCSLDDVHELVSIPFAKADLHERTLKIRVFEILMKTALQLLERKDRDAFQSAIVAQLAHAFAETAAATPATPAGESEHARTLAASAPSVETELAGPRK